MAAAVWCTEGRRALPKPGNVSGTIGQRRQPGTVQERHVLGPSVKRDSRVNLG